MTSFSERAVFSYLYPGTALVLLMLLAAVAGCQPRSVEPAQPSFIDNPDCSNLAHGALPATNLTLSTATEDIELLVEVADEPSERVQGLMCRDSVEPGTGMLFTYDSDRSVGFWMYNTYVPIDILFIDQTGEVIDIIGMVPCLRGPDDVDQWRIRCSTEATNYVPQGTWRYSLELPTGWLAERGIGAPLEGNLTVELPVVAR